MRPQSKLAFRLIALVLALSFACHLRRATPISRVLENPTAFRQVVVSGVVTCRVGFLGWNAYVLRDHTGEIHIITRGVLPRIGDRLRVTYKVRDVVVFGALQAVVLVETEPDARSAVDLRNPRSKPYEFGALLMDEGWDIL